MDIVQSVSDIANIIIAAVAIGTLGYSIQQSRTTQKQALEALQNQYRPLLVPKDTSIPLIDASTPDWNTAPFDIKISNVGAGVATNIRARLCGSQTPQGRIVYSEFIVREPLSKDGEKSSKASVAPGPLRPESQIGGHSLAAPKGMVVRLTLTYHDIFNNKHASIFDYLQGNQWHAVDFPKIKKDLEDLAKEEGEEQARVQQEFISQVRPSSV